MLKELTAVSAISTFLLLLLGGIVSGTNSGLGCGDHWPSCNGQLIPDLSRPSVVIEFTHRLVAALVGILVIWTVILAWRLRRAVPDRTMIRAISAVALLVLLAQVALGAVTVKRELPPEIVMLHLATGMALFALLVTMSTLLSRQPVGSSDSSDDSSNSLPKLKGLHGMALLAALGTYLQIVLGAYVRHSGASLACPDFPLCQGALIPTLSGLTLAHFAHRLGALLVMILVFWVAVCAHRSVGAKHALPLLADAGVLLVLLQIVLGALTVLSNLDVLWATLHLATAAALLAVLLDLSVRTRLSAGSSFSASPREAAA